MARIEGSPWAVSVAQVASRAGQSKSIDATFPAPSGIGDEIVGVDEGADVQVVGSFDSIVDGLILSARISAPVHAECTRCLKPIQRNWDVNVTAFFTYEDKTAARGGKNGAKASVASRYPGGGAASATALQAGLQGTVLAVRHRSERAARSSS